MPASPAVAFVFITHTLTRPILREYKNIAASVEGLGTPWFLYQGDKGGLPVDLGIANLVTVGREQLLALGYRMPVDWILPGASHFPLLHFFKDHPDYDHYWLIEYDVRFSGAWRDFFAAFAGLPADFLAAHIRRYADEPDWFFWELNHPGRSIPLEDRLRCFHPICRLSRRALDFLCDAHADGWCGHDELMLPTLLYRNGFSLADFGGDGEFVPPGLRNKYYTPAPPDRKGRLETGTFRYRPSYLRAGREPEKLYHPVKPFRWVLKERIHAALAFLLGRSSAMKVAHFIVSFYKRDPVEQTPS